MTIILAPLRGITGYLFRTAYARFFDGIDFAVAPFVTTVNAATVSSRHLRDILPGNNPVMRTIPQMIGNRAADLVVMARALADLGYTEVNWNLGCPFRQVTRKERGSGLLPHPARIIDAVEHLCALENPSLSLKVRLGLHDPDDLFRLLPLLEPFPLASITLHPRTADQMYSGVPDTGRFALAAAQSCHPLIYNGNITSRADYERLCTALRCAERDIMVGRGAIADPFLPARIKGRTVPAEPREHLRRFHDEVYTGYREVLQGPAHLLGTMKELWKLLAHSFPEGKRELKRLLKCSSTDAYSHCVDRLFAQPPSPP